MPIRSSALLQLALVRGEHPLGVQPWGNFYLHIAEDDQQQNRRQRRKLNDARTDGLGSLAMITDELVLEILGLLDAVTLARLGSISRALYAFCYHDDLWRHIVLRELQGQFDFQRSWRSTYIGHKSRRDMHCRIHLSDLFSDVLFQPWLCTSIGIPAKWIQTDNVQRRSGLSLAQFIHEFEQPNIPVVITDVVKTWPAFSKWSRESLINVAGTTKFDVGPVEMTLSSYLKYADTVQEESPLYLFDKTFADKVLTLGQDFEVPVYFSEDLFALLGSKRPDYRWLIIGPARSGSTFHIDPNATSAWNACITGAKKWILFPPGSIPPGVYPSEDGSEVTSSVSLAEWFINFYGEIKDCAQPPIEFVARAGDLVFVPSGWFHLVMNLEESIAITQNYVSRRNLKQVLAFLRDKPDLISGLRQCGQEANLFHEFTEEFERRFPGELTLLQQQWDMALKAEQLTQKPTLWQGLKSDATPFTFSFGALSNGQEEEEEEEEDLIDL